MLCIVLERKQCISLHLLQCLILQVLFFYITQPFIGYHVYWLPDFRYCQNEQFFVCLFLSGRKSREQTYGEIDINVTQLPCCI